MSSTWGLQGDLTLHGRIAEASNGAYLGEVDGTMVIYKPIRHERALWDFPGAVLAHREVAVHLISEALGWSVVPPTVLREGPFGPGMVQVWCEPDDTVAAVDIAPAGPVPPGYRHVFDGVDAQERPVQLVHEDSAALLRMAVFDVVINNADRKGGHVLGLADGVRKGIDHGIALHTENKLRTVLWGWAGEPVPSELLADIEALAEHLGDSASRWVVQLEQWLSVAELDALAQRCRDLAAAGVMPYPAPGAPAIPWPPF